MLTLPRRLALPRPAPLALPRLSVDLSRPEALAPAFVWGVWAVMTALAVRLVLRYGGQLPFWDEWASADLLTGHQPLTWQYLWSFHNEHRIPLPRLAYYLSVKLSGYDFRAPMLLIAASLSACAALTVRAAGHVRGRLTWSDAALPVLFLHAGHWDNLLWGFQTPFAFGTLFACAALALIASCPDGPGRRGLGAVAALLALMPTIGAVGVAFVPALVGWLVWLGWRKRAWPYFAVAAGAVLVVAAYFHGFERPAGHAGTRTVGDVTRTFGQLAAMGFGTVAGFDGPQGKPLWRELAGVLAALAVPVAVLLARRAWAGDRRAAGLLFFAAAALSLTAGMALGRAGHGPDAGLAFRYALLGTPLIACVYLAWGAAAPPATARLVQTLMFVVCLVLLWPNQTGGSGHAAQRRAEQADVARDLAAGLPRRFAHDRIVNAVVVPEWGPFMPAVLDRLTEKRIGLFGRIGPDLPLAETPAAVQLTPGPGLEADGDWFVARSFGAELRVRLDRPARVRGLKWRCQQTCPGRHAAVTRLEWGPSAGVWKPFPLRAEPGDSAVWIDGEVNELVVRFYTPGTRFRHGGLTLLTDAEPALDGAAGRR